MITPADTRIHCLSPSAMTGTPTHNPDRHTSDAPNCLHDSIVYSTNTTQAEKFMTS
jgi:hypothetical protein